MKMGCLSHTPNWGPGPHPRHVPWEGIKPASFQSAGRHSAHWAWYYVICILVNGCVLWVIRRKGTKLFSWGSSASLLSRQVTKKTSQSGFLSGGFGYTIHGNESLTRKRTYAIWINKGKEYGRGCRIILQIIRTYIVFSIIIIFIYNYIVNVLRKGTLKFITLSLLCMPHFEYFVNKSQPNFRVKKKKWHEELLESREN